jgi:hypothetical protein
MMLSFSTDNRGCRCSIEKKKGGDWEISPLSVGFKSPRPHQQHATMPFGYVHRAESSRLEQDEEADTI